MSDPGSAPPPDPLHDELEARAAELRALIEREPVVTSYEYEPPPAWHVERQVRRRRLLLVAGGLLVGAGVLLFVLLVTGVSLLGVLLMAPGLVLLALAAGSRPFYSLYLPGLALTGWGAGMIVDKAVGSPMYLSLVGLGVGLAVGWLARRLQVGWAHLWPLVTGLVLIVLGVLPGVGHPFSVLWHAWPLVLVGLGLVLVASALLPRRRVGGTPTRR